MLAPGKTIVIYCNGEPVETGEVLEKKRKTLCLEVTVRLHASDEHVTFVRYDDQDAWIRICSEPLPTAEDRLPVYDFMRS